MSSLIRFISNPLTSTLPHGHCGLISITNDDANLTETSSLHQVVYTDISANITDTTPTTTTTIATHNSNDDPYSVIYKFVESNSTLFCESIYSNTKLLILIVIAHISVVLLSLVLWLSKRFGCRRDNRCCRVGFAMFASLSFYFWTTSLLFSASHCFGLLAHQGPCGDNWKEAETPNSNSDFFMDYDEELGSANNTSSALDGYKNSTVEEEDTTVNFSEKLLNSLNYLSNEMSIVVMSSETDKEGDRQTHKFDDGTLMSISVLHISILVFILVLFVVNFVEAFTARQIDEKVPKFTFNDLHRLIVNLVNKPPQVGHCITCFHYHSKSESGAEALLQSSNKAISNGSKEDKKPLLNSSGNSSCQQSQFKKSKIVSFSKIENFEYVRWSDFSDINFVMPSKKYPVIDVKVVLNFYPGDTETAERYKAFIHHLTRQHSNKDEKITIDDYFHIEDQREWNLIIGDRQLMKSTFQSNLCLNFWLSCIFFMGWPMRLIHTSCRARHNVEIKKAVYGKPKSPDEERWDFESAKLVDKCTGGGGYRQLSKDESSCFEQELPIVSKTSVEDKTELGENCEQMESVEQDQARTSSLPKRKTLQKKEPQSSTSESSYEDRKISWTSQSHAKAVDSGSEPLSSDKTNNLSGDSGIAVIATDSHKAQIPPYGNLMGVDFYQYNQNENNIAARRSNTPFGNKHGRYAQILVSGPSCINHPSTSLKENNNNVEHNENYAPTSQYYNSYTIPRNSGPSVAQYSTDNHNAFAVSINNVHQGYTTSSQNVNNNSRCLNSSNDNNKCIRNQFKLVDLTSNQLTNNENSNSVLSDFTRRHLNEHQRSQQSGANRSGSQQLAGLRTGSSAGKPMSYETYV